MNEQRMNPEIKARWVAALRSGEYKQGRGDLRRESGEFCCLGVLCDLFDPDAWTHGVVANHHGAYGTPGDKVLQWSGLYDSNPSVTIGGVKAALANHNDGIERERVVIARTFLEIADAIEAQL